MSNGNGHHWSKFFWRDWSADKALHPCSLAAKGFWIEMLCIMHDGTPVGHLTLGGKQATIRQMAANAYCTEREAGKLLAELEAAGVFSRTGDGTIYCRRMVKDAAASEAGREHIAKRWNGKTPTPPNRGANREPNSPPTSRPNGEATSHAFRPPKSPPISLEADSEAEAEKESVVSINTSLSYPCSAREEPAPAPAAVLAVKTIVSRVVNALDSAGKQPLGRAPKLTVTQQQIAAVSEPGMDDLDPPPDWRRGPVDPVRTVEEQLAWLREHAA